MLSLSDPPADGGTPSYTDDEMMRFRWIMSVRRTRRLLVGIPALIALFVMITLQRDDVMIYFGIPHVAWRVAIAVVLVGLILFNLWNWRCPACDSLLRIRSFYPEHCDHCGITF
jgi:hypothetical protein